MKNKLILVLLHSHGLIGCNILHQLILLQKATAYEEPTRCEIPFVLREPLYKECYGIEEKSYEKAQNRMRDKFHRRSRWK